MRLNYLFLSLGALALGCSVYDTGLLAEAVGGEDSPLGDGDGHDGDGDGDGDDSVGTTGGSGSGGAGSSTGGSGNGSGGSAAGGSAAGGTGTGGTAAGGTAAGGTAAGGTGTGGEPIGIESIFDDFNPPAAYISTVEDRVGAWAVYNDGTEEGVMSPPWGMPFVTEAPPEDAANQALHVTASGFTVWGAGVYATLNRQDGMPTLSYDLAGRGYDAIRFRAKRGTMTAEADLRLALADEWSTTSGSCADPCAQDHATAHVFLTVEWADYTIMFDEMYRSQIATPIDFTKIYELHLNVDSDDIDFWIDDIRFVDFPD